MLEGDPRLQILAGIGQGLELVIGCHQVRVRVALFAFALGVDNLLGKETGPVEVQVGRQDTHRESVDLLCVVSGNMVIAQVLAHGGAVLAFHQGVIVSLPGPGLGEFDAQLLQ